MEVVWIISGIAVLLLLIELLAPTGGVLAVLDSRLKTMGYGRRFLASLPPAPVTDDLLDIARFFGASPDDEA